MSAKRISPTERFSNRVQDYTRYRPSYPKAAIDWLVTQFDLDSSSRVADVGSGTGKFSELLLSAGIPAVAVEPNLEMRNESDRLYENNPLYTSVSGSAEATLLDSSSIDMITAAQSFHWFDPDKTKLEFKRILRPAGVLALIWNRRENTSAFQVEYENMLRQLPEYSKVKHTRLDDLDIGSFFRNDMEHKSFHYSQEFDKDGLIGRVFSSSYTPCPDDDNYQEFSGSINRLFDRHSVNGRVTFTYSTEIYSGRLTNV